MLAYRVDNQTITFNIEVKLLFLSDLKVFNQMRKDSISILAAGISGVIFTRISNLRNDDFTH